MGPATETVIIEDTLITTSRMAEETPMKHVKFDESNEMQAKSLTPVDDIKDYEIHMCEIQLEKLKRTLSDDSSPYDLPDFKPSALIFPNDFMT